MIMKQNYVVAALVLWFPIIVVAQPVAEYSLEQIATAYANNSKQKVLLDPRVRGTARLIGQDIDNLDYNTFLAIMKVHNFSAIRSGGFLTIVPSPVARHQSMIVQEGITYADNDMVTGVINVKKQDANTIVSQIRPLMPSIEFISVFESSILITGTYSTYLRVKQLVGQLQLKNSKKSKNKF